MHSRHAGSSRSRSMRARCVCSFWTTSRIHSRPIRTSRSGRRSRTPLTAGSCIGPRSPCSSCFCSRSTIGTSRLQTPNDFWTSHFEIALIRAANDARAHIAGLPRCAFIGEWREEFRDWGFADRNPQALLDRLHYSRAIKTDYELECMRRASARAANGHHAAEGAFREGASEYEIHLAYLRATGHTDNELPYPSIVALNRNAAVLHYQHLDRRAHRRRGPALVPDRRGR